MKQTEEELFKYLVQGVREYAIFALDVDGKIVTWNMGAQRTKGYTADEIIGKHFSIFYTPEAKSVDHPSFELREATKNGVYEEEGWRVRKDGSQFWANVVITKLTDNKGKHIGFAKVTRDLTERKRYEIDLEQARDQALMANKLKSQFVANVTHEIRTPLSGVLGLIEIIARDPKLDIETHDNAVRVFDAARQLLAILNDLLDFAKLEAGKVTVENIPYSVHGVLDEVVGLTRRSVEEKHLQLNVRVGQLPEEVSGDPNKIRQVLLNLVHNAIKFTEVGAIEIAVEHQENELHFSVTDTGTGIAAELQEALFQPFAQAEGSTARLFGGTGLGLSIAQQYVQLLEGKIGLFSELGRGTTVWFSIPVHSPQAVSQ